jgi:sec-independent protein translocase protein TatA
MDALGPWHILIIVGFFVLLFGAKKLPEAARSLGRSARIMKTELTGMHDEPKTPATPVETVPVAGPDDGPR